MSAIPESVPNAGGSIRVKKTWHCGTLVYTRVGLVALFVSLLWGSFCFNLMQSVIPSILPLKLKSLGTSNLVMGILLTSVFPVFGTLVSPYLSFKSDYLRTRWGRRIPFFSFSLPFVVLSIVLLAFSQDIANFIYASGLLGHLSQNTVTILVMGICIVAFQFSDVLICSIYGYIFNDTVPVAVIGRFFGLMQVGGGLIGFGYNFFIFKYAESHMKEIFLGTAAIYLLGIGSMCLLVKEGKYPPVRKEERDRIRGFRGIQTYIKECFSHRFYWTKFLYAATPALTWAVVAPFDVFFYREMGLPIEMIGQSAAVLSVSFIAAAYFSSVFVDRWHPLRILAYSTIFALLTLSTNWIWIFVTLPPKVFFWLNMLGTGLIGAFHGALTNLSVNAFDIRLQPKSRFGQFSSAQSIVRNLCTVMGGVAIGVYYDLLKRLFHGSDFAYRFNFLWVGLWYIVAACLVCSLYRQWRKLGGDLQFHPPAPWAGTGFEELEQSPFVATQTRWLNWALIIFRAIMILSIGYLVPLTGWLWYSGWTSEYLWHVLALLPASVLVFYTWIYVERSIRSDVARCLNGQQPRDGIPHHGVLLLKGAAYFLLFFLTVGQAIATVLLEMRESVVLFGALNLAKNLSLIGVVVLLRRLERGFDPMLDYDGRTAPFAEQVAVPSGDVLTRISHRGFEKVGKSV